MKKILSSIICATLALSSVAMTASAAVATADTATSGSTDNKEAIISALLEIEPDWADSMADNIQFIDFNFDGTLEFVVKDYYSSGQIRTYRWENESLIRYDISYGDAEKLSNVGESDTFKALYDTNTGKYRMFGTYHHHNVSDPYYHEYEKAEVIYDDQGFISNIYSVLRYDGYDFGKDNSRFTYFDAEKKAISKDEYDTINASKTANCIDVNMHYDSFDMSFDNNQQTNFSKLNASDKKATLEQLYDSFTYDKQDTSTEDQKSLIIDSLISSEGDWLNTPHGITKEIQFIDFDFDGNLEFVVNSISQNGYLYTEIYNLILGDSDTLVKTEGDLENSVFATGVKGYYDKADKKYHVIVEDNLKVPSEMGGDRIYYIEVLPSTENTRQFVNHVFATQSGYNNYNYTDGNGNVLTKAQFDSTVSNYTKGWINANVKFNTYTIDSADNYAQYANMSETGKRSLLGSLYDSFTYDKYDREGNNDSNDTTQPKDNENTNNNPTNNSNNGSNNTVKSPATSTFGANGTITTIVFTIVSIILAAVCILLVVAYKRRKDIF